MSLGCFLLFASSKEVDTGLRQRMDDVGRCGIEIGVGKVCAAVSTTKLLATRAPADPAAVLLFGVAGAYRESGLEIGSLVGVRESRLADEGVELDGGAFLTLDALGMGGTPPRLDPAGSAVGGYDLDWTSRVLSTLSGGDRVPLARCSTVSTCSGTDVLAQRRSVDGEIETMESAAVARACEAMAVPLCEIRVVSNFCGDRERAGWDMPRAIETLGRAIETVIDQGASL